MALNSGNSCPAIFSAWNFTCWGDKLRSIVFHLISKEVWNIYRKTPVIYVVVQFYPQFKFYIPLFLGMVICMIMSLKQREIKFKPRIKWNHNIYALTIPRPLLLWWYNEHRCNEVLGITNGCSYPSNSKIYELKEPRYNETSSKQTYFVYPLALRSSTIYATI